MHASEEKRHSLKRQSMVKTKPKLTPRHSKTNSWSRDYEESQHHVGRKEDGNNASALSTTSTADDGYEAEGSDEESFQDDVFSDEIHDDHDDDDDDDDVVQDIVDDRSIPLSPWVLNPQELQARLEQVKTKCDKSAISDMPDDEQHKYFKLRSEHYVMGEGKSGKRLTRNRHTSHHVKADDAEMASLTMAHMRRDKQPNLGESFFERMDNSKDTYERRTADVYSHDELGRDNMRLSYRLSKGKLHPHFDSPTESFRVAHKPISASETSHENVDFFMSDEFENDGAFRRRRMSMTLALEEGELDVSGESGSNTPSEIFFRTNGEAAPIYSSSPTSITSENILQTSRRRDRNNISSEAYGTKETKQSRNASEGLMPSKDYHNKHRGSYSPESKTPKTPPPPRRALSLMTDREKEHKLKPKDFMAKLKYNFSRKSKPKEKKTTPVISAPISRNDSGTFHQTSEPEVKLRSGRVNRDPSTRLTWHGSTETDGGQFKQLRSRKVGVSPVENARYSVELQTSKSTMNVSEFARQVQPLADFYGEDSDGNSSSAFASPTSSICSSNPSSRPVSATDLPWERFCLASDIRRTESEGSVQLSDIDVTRRSSGSSVNSTPIIGTPPGNRSISSPASPLLRHRANNYETTHQGAIDIPTRRDLSTRSTPHSPHSGEDRLSWGKKVHRVTFEEDEKRRLQEAAKTPKPRHQPRRVKTDLGDNHAIITALHQHKAPDVHQTPEPTRRRMRRRAMSELGASRHIKEAIEQRRATAREQQEEAVNDENVKTTKVPEPNHSGEIARQGDQLRQETNGHKRSDSQGSITRSMSWQDNELKRSESTETLKRTPSVPSLVSVDSMDINRDEKKSVDMTTDKAPYLPANVDLQAYGLGPAAIFAEALWDHVTMDETELAFQAGDVIEVTDTTDKNWWWGYLGEDEGWIPTQFIRLRVSQGETVEECMERLHQENREVSAVTHGRISLSFLSNDQVRTNVVHEIITTERDYVRNLRDVCEGYLDQARQRPEMFSENCMQDIFGNIEEIYSFQKNFSLVLEMCIHPEWPHLSEIGKSFLNHERGFDIYSDYCNNYPRAVGELKVLMEKPKYQHFFEACRLLRNMIEISLHGFLLTPVQKICKYPLQLGELLKYTRAQHPDYHPLQEALRVMKNVAVRINERKRTIENIEKIAAWQKSILDWEGEDILVRSSQLIHSGEVTKVLQKSGRKRTVERSVYLFDHQLIICKKDMLRRGYQYRRRLNMDRCRVNDLPDGREHAWNINIKNGWKVWDTDTYKMYMFCNKSLSDKVKWLQAFEDEREIVEEDRGKGVHIPSWTKEAAMKHAALNDHPRKPSNLTVSRKISSMPFDYQHKIIEEEQTKVSLPESISSADVFKERRRKGLFGFRRQSDED